METKINLVDDEFQIESIFQNYDFVDKNSKDYILSKYKKLIYDVVEKYLWHENSISTRDKIKFDIDECVSNQIRSDLRDNKIRLILDGKDNPQ